MSGVTLSDLSKYHQGAMKWFKDGLVSKQNRLFAQTGEAGAVSFWPLGGTPLEGKVKFSFKETPPASGDKGPENPSAIAGVESIKIWRCGDNILPGNRKDNYVGEAGTFSTDADGYVSYSAMSDGRAFVYSVCNAQVYLHAGQQYVLHTEVKTAATSSYRAIKILDEDNTAVLTASPGDSDNSHTFTPPHDGMYGILYKIYDGTYRFSLYLGSEPPVFSSYSATDFTISLGSTYYGGEIDLATGLMTVTWGATVIKGTESFSKSANSGETRSIFSGTFDIPQQTMCRGQTAQTRVCSHFPFDTGFNMNTMMTWETTTNIFFTVPASEYPTKESFAEWLASEYSAGHPVTVGYKLHNPYTVQLTPLQLTALTQKDKYTPRVNTVYTDADSIQIRYRKSLIHDEDEKVQAIVALGGNV